MNERDQPECGLCGTHPSASPAAAGDGLGLGLGVCTDCAARLGARAYAAACLRQSYGISQQAATRMALALDDEEVTMRLEEHRRRFAAVGSRCPGSGFPVGPAIAALGSGPCWACGWIVPVDVASQSLVPHARVVAQ